MTDIFKPQPEKTYEHLWKFGEAILESFWTHKHFTYDTDVIDFKVNLSEYERGVVTRVMQSIALVENRVKTFWGRIAERLPQEAIHNTGAVFSMNETVHQKTYQSLPELLGIDVSLDVVSSIPVMEDRIRYLNRYLDGIRSRSNKEFTKSIILFTLLTEYTSLFSQFLILASFDKYNNVLSNFETVVSATTREENLHGKFGAMLIKIIRDENPEWFDDEMEAKIRRNVRKAYKAECKVLEWIYGDGELSSMAKESALEYLKLRYNFALEELDYVKEYDVDEDLVEPCMFFERNTKVTGDFDFFKKKSNDYNVADKVTEDDWDW